MGKALITGLAGLVLFGCATTEKARKNVEKPTKTPEQVTEDWREDMSTIREDTLKEAGAYENEFKKEIERVRQGKTQSYERVIELYGKLEEKERKAYEAEMRAYEARMAEINKEREAFKKAYEKAKEDLKKEKEAISQ